MTYSFNLTDQKWIPAVLFDGRLEKFSLRELLTRAHELRGLQGDSPLETAALYRLLLAVLHSTLRGPKKKAEWAELWQKGQWEPSLINSYLDQWRERFDLFHPDRPFYQNINEPSRPKSIVLLAHSMVTSDTLFDHHPPSDGEFFTCDKAARALITAHSFGLSGIYIPRPFTRYEFGPWSEGIVFFVEGESLFETLALNMIRINDETLGNNFKRDCPCWELEVSESSEQIKPQIPNGYLDFLTWQSRRILLVPEVDKEQVVVRKATVAPGRQLDDAYRDPMKHYTKRDTGWRVLEFSEEKMLWRDSHSLMQIHHPEQVYPPRSFDWLHTLSLDGYIETHKIYRFMAIGMNAEKARATINFYRQEQFPLPLKYLVDETLIAKVAEAITTSNEVRSKLYVATKTLAEFLVSQFLDLDNGKKSNGDDVPKSMKSWGFERIYWGKLETAFTKYLLDLLDTPNAQDAWNDHVRKAAEQSLDHSIAQIGNSSKALKASVKAQQTLRVLLDKQFSQEPQKEATA